MTRFTLKGSKDECYLCSAKSVAMCDLTNPKVPMEISVPLCAACAKIPTEQIIRRTLARVGGEYCKTSSNKQLARLLKQRKKEEE